MRASGFAVLSGIAFFNVNALGNQPSCGSNCPLYTQVWGEEFDNAIDTSVWNYRTDVKGNSAQLAANVGVSGGIMSIACKQESPAVSGKSFSGGGIISKPNFQYGYYEARMKMNYGSGWHSSFWQMAGDGVSVIQGINYTEFDTFEVESNNTSKLRSNVFDWTPGSNPNNIWQGEAYHNFGSPTIDWASDYHTFGTLWNENNVTFFFNGQVSHTYQYPAKTRPHDYLNIWVTSIAFQDWINVTALPSAVQTDYVRFYQRDYYITASSLCRSAAQGSTPCPSNLGYSENSGTWAASSLQGYTLQLPSRYSCSASPEATWTQKIGAGGKYDISVYNVALSGSDTNVTFSVTKNNVPVGSAKTVNQSTDPTGWVSLATSVSAVAGDDIVVKVVGSSSGCTRSDTVKLVRTA